MKEPIYNVVTDEGIYPKDFHSFSYVKNWPRLRAIITRHYNDDETLAKVEVENV